CFASLEGAYVDPGEKCGSLVRFKTAKQTTFAQEPVGVVNEMAKLGVQLSTTQFTCRAATSRSARSIDEGTTHASEGGVIGIQLPIENSGWGPGKSSGHVVQYLWGPQAENAAIGRDGKLFRNGAGGRSRESRDHRQGPRPLRASQLQRFPSGRLACGRTLL